MFSSLFVFVVGSTLVIPTAGPPSVDIRATCQASQNDIEKLFGADTAVTLDGCLGQENNAFEEIAKGWATYPAADKAQCVQRHGYMPSYVEWLTCLEIQSDLRKIRAQEKSDRAPRGAARNSRNIRN